MKKIFNSIKELLQDKNVHFVLRIILISLSMVLASLGYKWQSLTTWESLEEALIQLIKNPSALIVLILTIWQSFKQSSKTNNEIVKNAQNEHLGGNYGK